MDNTIKMKMMMLFLLSLPAAAGAKPSAAFARELAEMAAKGYAQEATVKRKVGGTTFIAVIFLHEDKSGRKFHVYAQAGGKARLVYMHPGGTGDRIRFDAAMSEDRFPDLLNDGSFCIIYHAAFPGLKKRTLYILRCSGSNVRLAGRFPEGEILRMPGSGRRMIVSKTLPLGRFFMAGCDSFATSAQAAFQTRLFAAKDGRLMDVSAEHPAFYDADIARLEETLASTPMEKQPGDFLSAAVSIYCDYEAKGERRQGWRRLNELIKPPSYPLPGLSACLQEARSDLRRKLDIPEDW